jgi:hypothetical protein
VEILHTFLLGVVKYAWFMTHSSWKGKANRAATFVTRLACTDTDGLLTAEIRASYILQYKDNLIGKHFKTLSQCQTFHLHDIVLPALFQLVKAIGALGAALWIPEIDDMDEYKVRTGCLKLSCGSEADFLKADLHILIDNMLDAFDENNASMITYKSKLHGMTHTPDDVERFGPAVRKSTEVFEKFNGVYRRCVVLGNRLADSRDVARQFRSMSSSAHLATGGFYFDGEQWRQADHTVLKMLHDNPILQRHFGWVPSKKPHPGKCHYLEQRASRAHILLGKIAKLPKRSGSSVQRFSVQAKSGDVCRVNSWVVARREVRVTSRWMQKAMEFISAATGTVYLGTYHRH